MESFPWDDRFVTGLAKVDEQHRHLVGVVNRFGAAMLESVPGEASRTREVLAELARYADYHFATERNLMDATGVDPRHAAEHQAEHDAFLGGLVRLGSSGGAAGPREWQQLLAFLTHWLIYHVLGTDQAMARQIRAVEDGVSPERAYEEHTRPADGATATLLESLNTLFQLVSERNRELFELNQTLEARVLERTRALAEANERLEAMAMTDALTGLPNRRNAMKRLAMAWEAEASVVAPVAVLLIDADDFKPVNDTHGHDRGDAVLRELATTLRHAVRTDDVVCRLGGDEFLVICPRTPLAGALHVAEVVRQRVAELRIPAGVGAWHGSISVGVAVRDPGSPTPEALIKQADEGVYMAKRAGRNCVKSIQT